MRFTKQSVPLWLALSFLEASHNPGCAALEEALSNLSPTATSVPVPLAAALTDFVELHPEITENFAILTGNPLGQDYFRRLQTARIYAAQNREQGYLVSIVASLGQPEIFLHCRMQTDQQHLVSLGFKMSHDGDSAAQGDELWSCIFHPEIELQ